MADIEALTTKAADRLKGGHMSPMTAAYAAIKGAGITNESEVRSLSKKIVRKLGSRGGMVTARKREQASRGRQIQRRIEGD